MTPKQFAAAEVRSRLDTLKRLEAEARVELATILATPPDRTEPKPVAPHYRAQLATLPSGVVIKDARSYSRWLADKVRATGPGSACDSGEAKICALLDELVARLEA